jgi:hypothetical protein
MTQEQQPIRNKDHRVRNAGILATASLAIAMVGGACANNEVKPSYSPSPTATELATPSTSAAAGSASPEASVMPSASPEVSATPSLFTVIHHEAIGQSTIVFLPKNTVWVGDPIAIWTEETLPDGTKLETYGKKTYDPLNKDQYLAAHGGQIVTDSDQFTGFVGVTEEAVYVQTSPEHGLSYQTVENAEEAEKLAQVKKIETEFLGCDKGCELGVDIVHVPGETQEMVHTGASASENPSESTMPSAMPSLSPESSLPEGVNLTNMTQQQEVSMILGWLNSGKIDPNSEVGLKLIDYLRNCLCQNGVTCEVPKPTSTPKPSATPSPEVCVQKRDIEHPYKGWKDVSKAPVEKYDGEALFQSDGTVFENGKKITKYGYANGAAIIFYVKDNLDGKPTTYRYDFGGDLQPLECIPEEGKAKALENDITGALTRKENPVNKVIVVTVENNGKYTEKLIKKADWLKAHPVN